MSAPWGRRATGLRRERMHASAQWGGAAFRNSVRVVPGLKSGTAGPLLREALARGVARVPPAPLPVEDPRPLWNAPVETGVRATWLGHSTVLLELDGYRVLTDPVWALRASPAQWAGPRRFHPPPVSIAQLPPLDAVLLSHDHFDHLDAGAVAELARTGVPFFTSLGVGVHLEAFGVDPSRIVELDWWESASVANTGLTVTAAPSQHFSGRSLNARNGTLWSSLVVRGPRHAVFFSGDTGLTPEYADIGRRLGPFDLVLLEVGAFHPAWGDIHLGPENALQALQMLGGGLFLPVHWGTFPLALHAWDQPARMLVQLAEKQGVSLVMPRLGRPVEPVRSGVDPWWLGVEPRRRSARLPAPAIPPAVGG